MKHIVIKEHKSDYPDPIKLTKGDLVLVKERHVGLEGWENWLSCTNIKTGKTGWVPEQLLKQENNNTIATDDYSAHELSVSPGEIVEGLKELNGWLWCRNQNTHELGWLPLNAIKLIENEKG